MASYFQNLSPQRPKNSGVVNAMTGTGNAFLPPNYNFNDLANYEGNVRRAQGASADQQIMDRRNALSTDLAKQGQDQFNLMNPGILEDLNNRGVFHSPTAVANAQTNALKEIELANQDKLRSYDEAALGANLQGQQDALDSSLDLRRGNLQNDLQTTQANNEQSFAERLAGKQGRNQLTNSLIGAGGSLLGAGLGKDGFLSNLFKTKASPLTAAGIQNPTAATAAIPGAAGASGYAGMGGTVAGTPLVGPATASEAAGGAAPAGIGLGGAAAIGGAGIGAALLSRAAQNKVGSVAGNNAGTAAGIVANPIGYQINQAKNILSGGGHSNGTGSGNATATEQRQLDSEYEALSQLKQAVQSGQMTPEEYQSIAQPKVEEISQRVGSLAGKSSAWANAVNPNWKRFQDSGLVAAQNGRWVAL